MLQIITKRITHIFTTCIVYMKYLYTGPWVAQSARWPLKIIIKLFNTILYMRRGGPSQNIFTRGGGVFNEHAFNWGDF